MKIYIAHFHAWPPPARYPAAPPPPFLENYACPLQVIFKEAAHAATMKKYLSLFPGLGFGAGYKILQRVYKFGGQVWEVRLFFPNLEDAVAHLLR